MNKINATLAAWALAPLTAIVSSAVVAGLTMGWDDIASPATGVVAFYIAAIAYFMATVFGIPVHIYLVYRRKTEIINYSFAGALPVFVVVIIFASLSGYSPAQWTAQVFGFSAYLTFNAVVVATAFGGLYSGFVTDS